jgi:ribosomal protein L11 methylase PrmA
MQSDIATNVASLLDEVAPITREFRIVLVAREPRKPERSYNVDVSIEFAFGNGTDNSNVFRLKAIKGGSKTCG